IRDTRLGKRPILRSALRLETQQVNCDPRYDIAAWTHYRQACKPTLHTRDLGPGDRDCAVP
ncbi:MAG: hypothetical protein ACREMY_14410, partial [bacterium]